MSEESNIIGFIENDDFYNYFLHSSTKSHLDKCLSITDQVQKLGEGIDLINKQLHQQVLENYDDLLQQANHASKLENIVNTMNSHVQNLFANAERLKNQISGPYQSLENHTKVLSRLHLASHILRQVNRIQQLSKRLSTTNDPLQRASILQELEQLASDPDLTDVDAVTAELRNIRSQQQAVVKIANTSLNQGVINENSTQVTTALQIFINLGTLKFAMKNFIDIVLSECRESLKTTFDVRVNIDGLGKTKGGPGRANLTSSQGFRDRVWADLEKAFSEEIFQQCKQVKFLQTTLLNMNQEFKNVASEFWAAFGLVLMEEVNSASSSIQQMLEEDYPKFLKSFFDMIQKLNYSEFKLNREILEKYENLYLSSSWSKLLEPTQTMFQENSAPSHDQIDVFIRSITGELSVALVEATLIEKIARNVAKCLKLFAVKTEQLMATGPDSTQVIAGAPNNGQILNVQMANAMNYLEKQIYRMLANMKDSFSNTTIEIITDSLDGLKNLTTSIIQPLVTSISNTIETILITMHVETDWAKLQASNKPNIPCSPYMRELVQFINRVYPMYLANFDNKEILSVKCGEIAIRCMELMIRHSSILRPIVQAGRLRLNSDFNHLEQALKTLYPHLSDLGKPYRTFKSMATLVTLAPADIVESQKSGSSVPDSTVLLLLFSYANQELASPHQNTGWTINKISSWLDIHTEEKDRLNLIIGALQRYEKLIRQKNITSFDPVYPIMSSFVESIVKEN